MNKKKAKVLFRDIEAKRTESLSDHFSLSHQRKGKKHKPVLDLEPSRKVLPTVSERIQPFAMLPTKEKTVINKPGFSTGSRYVSSDGFIPKGKVIENTELINYIKECVPLLKRNGRLFAFDGMHYVDITDKDMAIMVFKRVLNEDIVRMTSQYQEIYRQLMADHEVFEAGKQVKENEDVLVFANGSYKVSTGEFFEGYYSADDYAFSIIDVAFDPHDEYGADEVDAFVDDFCNHYPERVKLFWQILGVILSNYSPKQCIFYFLGVPDAGKSTVCRFIEGVIGKDLYRALSLKDLTRDYTTSDLVDVKVCADEDVAVNVSLRSKEIETIKKIASSDMIRVRAIYSTSQYVNPRCKFIWAANGVLKFASSEDLTPIYKRMVVFPLDHSIPKNQQDPYILNKLNEGRNYAICRALKGAREWIHNNYQFDEIISPDECFGEAVFEDGLDLFVQSKCYLEEEAFCSSGELYQAYCEFCEELGIVKSLSQVKFVTYVKSKYGLGDKRSRSKRFITGISLNKPSTEELNE